MIRPATAGDHDGIWEIFSSVIRPGDTYVFDPETPRKELEKHWLASNMHTYVYQTDRRILGTYFLKPNQVGLGDHIANAGYMVHPEAQGKGIGQTMCEHSMEEARRLGYHAMQFNIVVSTNVAAIAVWKKFGFEIVGTLSEVFRHRKQGLVDAYVMYRKL